MEDWLDRITKEIELIYLHLDLFKKLNEIIDKNDSLKRMDTTVLYWIRTAFIVDLVIGIGRICDKHPKSNSLTNFLIKLKSRNEYLTRARYVGLYNTNNPLILKIANDSFDGLAGTGIDTYPLNEIEADIRKITKNDPCAKIIAFRDQYIAHSDIVKDNPPPTYEQLLLSFKIIEEVVKKYYHLIKCSSLVYVTPCIQGNWEEVFTILPCQINNASM